MNVEPLPLPGVFRVTLDVFRDDRGAFMETWQARKYAACGIDHDFVQDNWSESRRGVLRGLHYQLTQPQGKLVAVVAGEIFDVVVDVRRSSPTFGQWVSETLSADRGSALWVPPGFAHGFYVVSDRATVLYKCTDYYQPGSERTLLWNDPQLAIVWPLAPGAQPILSAKDAKGAALAEADVFEQDPVKSPVMQWPRSRALA
jgi:dTDP-4-dehydrorhamnose 3,5-epimerase